MTWKRQGTNGGWVYNNGTVTMNEGNLAGIVKEGDLLVACIAYRGNAAFTLPTGWTLAFQTTGGDSNTPGIAAALMAYTVRGATAPSMVFTRTGGDVAIGTVIAYEGASAAALDQVSALTALVPAQIAITSALSTAEDGELLVAMVAGSWNNSYSGMQAVVDPQTPSAGTAPNDHAGFPAPLAWSEIYDNNTINGSVVSIGLFDAIKQSAGTTGQMQVTGTATPGRQAMIVASFKLWEHSASQAEVSKASTYAIAVPTPNSVSVSKGSTYAIAVPTADAVAISKMSSYVIFKPQATKKRRYSNVHPAAKIGNGPVIATDPYFANVMLLLGFEGANGATTVVDESPLNPHAMIFGGNAQISTASPRFDSGSLLLDGSSDSVTTVDSNDWDFGAGQFTVELWVKPATGFSTNEAFIGQWGSGGQQPAWFLYLQSGLLTWRFYDSTQTLHDTTAAWTPTVGTWYHVAADRDDTGKIRVYVDGVMKGSASFPQLMNNSAGGALSIGSIPGNATFDMQGNIDEVRITKGVARYKSDAGFAVPTARFPRLP